MQEKNDDRATVVGVPTGLAISKEALALLSNGVTLKPNALSQVSHAVYFR